MAPGKATSGPFKLALLRIEVSVTAGLIAVYICYFKEAISRDYFLSRELRVNISVSLYAK